MHFKILLVAPVFISMLFIHLHSQAQRDYYTKVDDSQDYYKVMYERNLDSLHASWVIENYLGGPLVAKSAQLGAKKIDPKYYYGITKPSIRTSYHARIGEVLDIYLGYEQKTENALAVFDFYKHDMDSVIKEYNLPEDMVYMSFAVSAMSSVARTETGAAGYWQIMYPVARKYGLSISSYVDDRKQILKSTEAAAKYLQQLNSIYHNWELSIAAYMCSPSTVNKAIRRANQQMEFDSIAHFLPRYAQDISYAICASKIMYERRSELTLELPEFSPDVACDTVQVSQRLHFKQLEAVLELPVKQVRFLNPQYKYNIVPAMHKVHYVLLPAGHLEEFNNLEDSIYAFNDSILFHIQQKVVLPPPAKGRHYAKREPEKIPTDMAVVYYNIKSGDNLGYVAEWYNVSLSKLQDWNFINDPRKLQINQKIKVYVPKQNVTYYKRINTMTMDQKKKLSGSKIVAPPSSTATPAPKKTTKPKQGANLGGSYTTHIVKSGESPYLIAQKYPGVSAEDILRWNNISDPRSLNVGQKLKIKKL